MIEQLIGLIIFNLGAWSIALKILNKKISDDDWQRSADFKTYQRDLEEQMKDIKDEINNKYDSSRKVLEQRNLQRFDKVEQQLRAFAKWNNDQNEKKTKASGGSGDYSHNDIKVEDHYPAKKTTRPSL